MYKKTGAGLFAYLEEMPCPVSYGDADSKATVLYLQTNSHI